MNSTLPTPIATRQPEGAVGIACSDLLDLVGNDFRTILADPPWPFKGTGHWKRKKGYISKPPYPTMTLAEICALPVGNLAAEDCHLWLWTDNVNLHNGFHVMEAWGFKYLAPIHWIKPSGCGCWWIHRTQTMLFGYKKKCRFPLARFRPNLITTSRDPKRHSEKPEESYALIESVSQQSRLELFARKNKTEPTRAQYPNGYWGFTYYGDERDSYRQCSRRERGYMLTEMVEGFHFFFEGVAEDFRLVRRYLVRLCCHKANRPNVPR